MPNRLNIGLAFDDSLDRPSGISHYLRALAASLLKAGHQVTHLVGESVDGVQADARVISLARNVPVRFNGSAASTPVWCDRRRLNRVLARERFDVVHIQMPYSPILSGRLIHSLPPHTALVGTYHVHSEGWLARTGATLLASASRRTLGRFDAIMAVSDTAARSAARCFGLENCLVVPTLLDVAAVEEAVTRLRRPGRRVPRIVYIGALVRRKGAADLIDAGRLLARQGREVEIVIAGRGPLERSLRRRARGLGVNVVGAVSEGEKIALLADADLACFPAHGGESLGVVLLEAMAAGVPVIAGNNSGYAETLAGAGLLSSPAPKRLAGSIASLLDDPVRRIAMIEGGSRVIEAFHSDRVTSQILAVYEDALSRRRLAGTRSCVWA